MRRTTVIGAIVIAMSISAVATVANAAPTREWVPIDETFTFNDCGFPIQERDQLRLRFVTWSDADGNRTRQLVVAPGAKITYTGPGGSVTTANPFAVHKTYNADGSATIAFTGLVFAINGGGRVYVDSGRELIVFDNGDVQPVSDAGPTDDLCEALAATIG